MPVYESSVTVAAPLSEVWAFHQDVMTNLAALSPPEAGVRVESADPLPPRLGTRVVITARAPVVGRVRWLAEYVEHRPPGDDGAAWFTDVQVEGPFKSWRHTHRFEAAGDKRTVCRDHVEYRVPGGPLAGLADAIIVRRQLKAMFDHRAVKLAERFGRG